MTHSNNPYSGYEQAVPNALNNPSANAIHMLAPRTFVRTKENLLGAVQEAMQQAPMPAFDAVTVAFLIDFSKRLLSESEPELKALGFWLRKSQISKWQNEYTHVSQKESEHSTILRFPIGSVLHFTPANVDTMFVYSWICALVLGNISVLRLSRQESQIKQRLLQMINDLYAIPDYQEIARRNLFITYEHASAITQSLSAFADARILWGGDQAVNLIRQIPAKPKTRDIGFADRYSVAVINGNLLNENTQIAALAEKLWRDIQPYQQQACSSPKILFWVGDQVNQMALVQRLNFLANQTKPDLTRKNEHLIVSQLVQSKCKETNVLIFENISVLGVTKDALTSLRQTFSQWHCGNGMLYLVLVSTLEQALKALDPACQTLSYWGFEKQEMVKLIQNEPIMTVDRVVPIGQALDFHPVWDGYDLVEQLQRKITVL